MNTIIQYIVTETKTMYGENLEYLKTLIAKTLGDQVGIKAVVALAVSVYGFAFDALKNDIILALFVLTFFDFVTGIIAAKMTKERIQSARVFRTALKIFVYSMMISGAYLGEKIVPITSAFLDETMLGFLALTELISLIENVGRMGYVVPQKLLNKLEELRGDEEVIGTKAKKNG